MKRLIGLFLPLAAALSVAACGDRAGAAKAEGGGKGGPAGASQGRKGPQAYPVEVAAVEARPVEFAVNAVGSVEAFETVQVTARVAGAVEKVRFVEGQSVQKGDVLVEVEPQRYQLAVRAAEATLQKAQASKAQAEASAARRQQVDEKNPGLIRGEELDSFRSLAQTAAAEAAMAQVALEQAQLNLHDAFIRAPVAGVLQTRTVQTGQYVQPGAVLATLLRRDPLLLRFQVPEADSARIAPGMTARFKVGGASYAAKISHVAAQANLSSRMVAITADVDAAQAAQLRAGAFAEVIVPIGQVTAPVIPQTAVRPSEHGFLAYVVEEGRAKEKVLTLGMRTEDGRVEVRAGLKAGEQLVVRGAEALKDGSAVAVAGGGKG